MTHAMDVRGKTMQTVSTHKKKNIVPICARQHGEQRKKLQLTLEGQINRTHPSRSTSDKLREDSFHSGGATTLIFIVEHGPAT